MIIPIVTYHYVRPQNKRFSENHKSLDLQEFLRQLDILNNGYHCIRGAQINDLTGDTDLSGKKPVWLSFDDGYSDHYNYVFPELMSRGAVGSFFIPTEAIFGRKLLDVNKVHLILAANSDINDLIEQIRELFNTNYGDAVLDTSFDELQHDYSVATLINDPDTRFVKLLLQELLPGNLREIILSSLFKEHVKRSESAVVDELYMDPDQVKSMYESGMHIGSHGHMHSRLEFMTHESQLVDFELSVNHLRSIGVENANVVVCYPYGSFNKETKTVLSNIGCKAAISAKLGIVDTNDRDFDWLELSRIDTKFFSQYFGSA